MKKAELTLKPNFLLIPVNQLKINSENAIIYNNELQKCKDKNYNIIKRSSSGGISYKTIFPAYDIRNTSSCAELTILDTSGMYRIQFRNSGEKNGPKKSGSQAFRKFKKLCSAKNINLDDYAEEDGAKYKKEIEYFIKMEDDDLIDKTIIHAYHLDFHSSFPSGLVRTHPEFKDIIKQLYDKRKTDETSKLILNATIGYMQSTKCCKARWAKLSRDSIKDNNDRLKLEAERLKQSGRLVIAYNTDGIWYSGEEYHDENEGDDLGTWRNDHKDCKIRFKSAGSYEFIEDGKYFPVVRGHTILDEIKPREEWEWGDIYTIEAQPEKYSMNKDGFITLI